MPVPPKAKQGELGAGAQSRKCWGEAFGVKIFMGGDVAPWILFFCLVDQMYDCNKNRFC